MPTPIASRLLRNGDSYLLDDADLKGGFRSVATIAERNAIALVARRVGMVVFVQEDSSEYTLRGTIGNASWIVRPSFSGKLHTTFSVVNVLLLQQFDPYTFQQYCAQKIVNWFNAQTASDRTITFPTTYFNMLCAVGDKETTQYGKVLPDSTTYLGECLFVYDAAASSTATTLKLEDLFCLSKTLIPLGDSVETAMNEYAERKSSENADG